MTPAEINVCLKGYESRVKERAEEANVHAWLVGAYVRIAVASALDSGVDYPERPFGMEQEAEAEAWETSKLKMADFAARVDRKLKQTPGKKEDPPERR